MSKNRAYNGVTFVSLIGENARELCRALITEQWIRCEMDGTWTLSILIAVIRRPVIHLLSKILVPKFAIVRNFLFYIFKNLIALKYNVCTENIKVKFIFFTFSRISAKFENDFCIKV